MKLREEMQSILEATATKYYPEDLKWLAKRYGVTPKELSGLTPSIRKEVEDWADKHALDPRSPLVVGKLRELLRKQ